MSLQGVIDVLVGMDADSVSEDGLCTIGGGKGYGEATDRRYGHRRVAKERIRETNGTKTSTIEGRSVLRTSSVPAGMEDSPWQWPKGVVGGKIPKDYSPMPAIEDEVYDIYHDAQLQSVVLRSTMDRFVHTFSSHTMENVGGFKAARVDAGCTFRCWETRDRHWWSLGGAPTAAAAEGPRTHVTDPRPLSADADGSRSAEVEATGPCADPDRGPSSGKRIVKVSARFSSSSSRTNIINYRQTDSHVQQFKIPNAQKFLQRQPAFTLHASLPRFEGADMDFDSSDSGSEDDEEEDADFELAGTSGCNGSTSNDNDEPPRRANIVWCKSQHQRVAKSRSTLANPSQFETLGRRRVVDPVNGFLLKEKDYRRPHEVKVVVRINNQIMMGHTEQSEAAASASARLDLSSLDPRHPALSDPSYDLTNTASLYRHPGSYNMMVSVDVPKCISSTLEDLAEWKEAASSLTSSSSSSSSSSSAAAAAKKSSSPKSNSSVTASVPLVSEDGYIRPLLKHIPLDDGPLRVVCLKAGNLQP